MFPNLAEYIEHATLNSEADNHKKYTMTWRLFGWLIDMDNIYYFIYDYIEKLMIHLYISTTSNSQTNIITNITVNMCQ